MSDHELHVKGRPVPGSIRRVQWLWILISIVCGSIAVGCSSHAKIQFYERAGNAGKVVRAQCDREADVLYLYLAAECFVASALWITVTAKDTNTILCSTHGNPRCTIDVTIPPISADPDRVPTKPVEVKLTVPGLANHPGEIIIEVGGTCDTGAKAVGGASCLVKRH